MGGAGSAARTCRTTLSFSSGVRSLAAAEYWPHMMIAGLPARTAPGPPAIR